MPGRELERALTRKTMGVEILRAAPGAAGALLLTRAVWLGANYGLRQGALFLVGAGCGLVLYHAAFGFTTAFRVFVIAGDGRGLRAQMLMLALATLLFAPLLARSAPAPPPGSDRLG